jgi:rare lipoprotein A
MATHFIVVAACAVLAVGCAQAPELAPAQLQATDLSSPPQWRSALVSSTMPSTVPVPETLSAPVASHSAPVVASLASTPTLSARPSPQPVRPPSITGQGHSLTGIASYYWQDQMTSSGERFDKRAMTAAHKTLPLGTRVRVTHVASGRSVVVRINDRGPFKPGRVIDLSEAAAEQLQMTTAGLAAVTLDVVK